jgi:DNA-binding response OmpR family regulator
MLTASGGLGADDYLGKPFAFVELPSRAGREEHMRR